MAAGKLNAQTVGTKVKIKEDGVAKDYIVLSHTYPKSGYTLLMRDRVDTNGYVDGQSNYGMWGDWDTGEAEDMSNYVLPKLESQISSNIPEIAVKSHTRVNLSNSVDSKIFALSYTEVGFTPGDPYPDKGDGTKIPYFDSKDKRIGLDESGSAIVWYLRSGFYESGSGGYGCAVSRTGTHQTSASTGRATRFAFCLPGDMFVQADGLVVENTPPVISGSNGALGTFGDTPPSYQYTVTDAQGGTVSVTEKVDSTTLRTYNVTLGSRNTLTIPTATWKSLSNGSHTLTITAKDSHGATATRTQTFTKNATAPVISGSNGNLGSFGESGPTYQYTVTDAQGGTVTVAEKLDGAALRTYTVTLGSQNTLSFTADAWRKVLNGSHTLTITATDPLGLTATRTQTFTKNVTSCAFETAAAFPADAMPDRCIVNVQGEFPEGCTLKVEICNNGSDASPTWEDITQNALNNQKYFFTNKTKTASAWGVKLRATLSRGTASGECFISSLGGNFQ